MSFHPRFRALCVFCTFATSLASLAAGATSAGCDTEDATSAVVENAYPVVADGGDPSQNVVVYKVWWVATLFPDPVAPGQLSTEYRSVSEYGVAIALLAPGWNPSSGSPPTTLIPVKSKEVLRVSRGNTLRITISDETFGGNCAAHQQLPQEDADFITQRIFPGDFANVTYDAHTCRSKPVTAPDAGAR
jgi:hypothetical protein